MNFILPSHLESFEQLHNLLKLLNAKGVAEFLAHHLDTVISE